MRRRPQAHDLRSERDGAIVGVPRCVVKPDQDGHGYGLLGYGILGYGIFGLRRAGVVLATGQKAAISMQFPGRPGA
jgi:hypothetical protein